MKKLLSLVLAITLAFGGAFVFTQKAQAEDNGQNGTTLSADITANGYWVQEFEYDWTLEKKVEYTKGPNYDALVIDRGQTKQADYTLTATRVEPPTQNSDKSGVKGDVTVTNGGEVATLGLEVIVQLQSKSDGKQFADVPGASVPAEGVTELQAGETKTFSYNLPYTAYDPALQYRVVANITIDNHSGYLGQPFGPNPKADVTFPAEPTKIYIDATATLYDGFTYFPVGYNVVAPDQPNGVKLTGSTIIPYKAEITNVAAAYDTFDKLDNTAKLIEDDTLQEHTASATVIIYDPAPKEQALTIGYWKTHAGFTGHNLDRVTPLLPISLGTLEVTSAAQAVEILNMSGNASNGIYKLQAQLLAAKLNIKNGAPHSKSTDNIISAADAFLAGNPDWNKLSGKDKNKVLNWMTTLDNYNNGLIL